MGWLFMYPKHSPCAGLYLAGHLKHSPCARRFWRAYGDSLVKGRVVCGGGVVMSGEVVVLFGGGVDGEVEVGIGNELE